MDKYEIAQILKEIGIYIELLDENPSKGFAYRRAAESIENLPDLDQVIQNQGLEELPGIGKKIAQLIYVLKKRGSLSYYENLKSKLPTSIFELLNIPGMSVQRVRMLFKNWGVKNLKDFRQLLRKKRSPAFPPRF